jgi:hypothetical protein
LDILPEAEKLATYKFLGYLGTNFDLVDGVQAKNLFFATNIFIPETHRWGVSFSIYGNRSMTKTDSSKNISFTSRIVNVGRDSVAYYRDTAMKISTLVSDNIGANFTPLIPIKFLEDGELKVYYAPQFEFIWRRTKMEDTYVNNGTSRIDTARNRFPAGTTLPLITPLTSKVNLNIYDVYLGLAGILLRYETEEISIRASGSIGFNFNYTPIGGLSTVNSVFQQQKRVFYFGRLWITEPTTGLTLGSEVSSYFGKYKELPHYSKAQPFFNVTLSKAFDLKNLATLVKPLTSR